jgi:uroporphyrinogen III methyltransferase/synthase
VPVEVPTIAVEPPRTPPQMERAIKGLVTGRYELDRASRPRERRCGRCARSSTEFGLDARAFAGVKIACVGESTADAVASFGIIPSWSAADTSPARACSGCSRPTTTCCDPIDRVLLPRADIATETLSPGLQERGWEIDDVTAYRTVRRRAAGGGHRRARSSRRVQAVCFTSSSTVRNLVGIAGKPHAKTVVACIGTATAETAAEFGLRVDVQPEKRVRAGADRRAGRLCGTTR